MPCQEPISSPLKILLCKPRGFCAGVDRAIQIVEKALQQYGAPVYVRHEIVHNRYVVNNLKKKGAVFVEELSEVPDDGALVIFSAHGVPKSVPVAARQRKLFYLDATCPLVSKVHREAERHFSDGRKTILIGHARHPEVIGTMGQLPLGAVSLVETAADAHQFTPKSDAPLAYITQTTLSLDDTKEIIDILMTRFPGIKAPRKDDICYATTNRQQAVKAIAHRCDAFLIVGAPNSSNSMRLVEVASRSGCTNAVLVQRASDIDWASFAGVNVLGISAGASAPDVLVDEIIENFEKRYQISVETITTANEDIAFKLPKELNQKHETPQS
ncbi:MAG: 4-hydroxy-3-methylbut-2-enyl diphosphate reductase [bacterium]|nr:4-hydroxy-3-methylbut-2-enyl diphosphate reductase [bacterium]